MCGRFSCSTPPEMIAKAFRTDEPQIDLGPRYNIAPSQDVLIVVQKEVRQIVTCRWGFVPSWSTEITAGNRMINARAETIAEKTSFRTAFRRQRCLIIADGFYEWKRTGRKKEPFYIRLKSGEPFGFAGLYTLWKSPVGEKICTCTIITTRANAIVAAVHERMPVIIPKEAEPSWLEPDNYNETSLLNLLKPYPAEDIELYPVSPLVNRPVYDMPEAIHPVRGA